MIRHRSLLPLLGLSLAVAMAPIAFLGDLAVRTLPFLGLWGAAHAVYLGAAWLVTRPRPQGARSGLAIVLGTGLLVRILLLPAAPTLSEDVYRYLWDGRLVAAGVNPYPHPPNDPTLGRFREGFLERLNHAEVPTIYPPAAQLLFGAVARIDATPLAWKIALLLIETALIAALLALLRRRGLPDDRILLYYWNPLVLIESYGSGHLDLGMAAFFVVALALLERGRPVRAGIAYGVAALTKYLPILLLPYLLRRRAFLMAAAAVLAGGALFLPFAGAGGSAWSGLLQYARHWEFNGPLFLGLRAATGSGETARRVLAALLAAAVVAIGVRARSAPAAALGALTACLLLSPTVYPWYAVPIVALLPLRAEPGLLLFSGLLGLSYLALPAHRETGVWSVPDWVMLVEYGVPAATWAVAAWTGRSRPRQGRDAAWMRERSPTYRNPKR